MDDKNSLIFHNVGNVDSGHPHSISKERMVAILLQKLIGRQREKEMRKPLRLHLRRRIHRCSHPGRHNSPILEKKTKIHDYNRGGYPEEHVEHVDG